MSEVEDDGDDDSSTKPIQPLVREVRRDMRKVWRQDDRLLDKFFPIDASKASVYQKVRKELYNDRMHCKRWTGIPVNPKPLSRIYRPLTYLMNRILFHCNISKYKRVFLDTHLRRPNPEKISPGIFLAGVGPEFGNTSLPLPRAFYMLCISAFEVTLESDDMTEARDRLAAHMHTTFQFQDNRRFAFGLIITQNTFVVYMFDHAGAVASTLCNYHENPEQFCTVIAGLAGDGERIGFDTTMVSESGSSILRTSQFQDGGFETTMRFEIEASLFQFSSLVGRGTVCWLTHQVDDPAKCFVIKDAWIPESELEGRESEGSLLSHAQKMGVTTGVAQILHVENVLRSSTDASDFDTILRNRRTDLDSPAQHIVDRVHTRIIMTTHGKTLDEFSTQKELILAFHDAVLGHRNLHQIAGILHRDISVRNILINVDGAEGDRGILIDLDHAIRIEDTSPYSTKKKIGTRRYMSMNVLEDGLHTYLDDLESFYYVLVWILVTSRGPGVVISKIPSFVSMWDHPCSSMTKRGELGRGVLPPINPWFGACFSNLVLRFIQFFKTRFDILGLPLSRLDPVKDYDEFIEYVQECITDMGVQDHAVDLTGCDAKESLATGDHELSEESISSDEYKKPPARKRQRTLSPKIYPKRSAANYGPL